MDMAAFVNCGGETYGLRNCALCTVAAIFDADTRQVSNMLGLRGAQPEGSFALAHRMKNKITTVPTAGEELQQDFDGMKSFVKLLMAHMNKPVYVSQGGSYDTPVPLHIQTALMRSYPVGTQFAVWASQEMKGYGAHWNYAVRTDAGVEYRDYQYNTSTDHPPRISDHFIPPPGGMAEAREYVIGVVLTFRGTQLKMPFEH
jgi:hypothetical protein